MCLESSASVPRLLLISQRKEFCSAAQTFLCIFLRRALTMALTVAPSERELRRVAIPLCFHGSLVSLKAETVAACVFFCTNHLQFPLNGKTFARCIHGGQPCPQFRPVIMKLLEGFVCFAGARVYSGFFNNGNPNMLFLSQIMLSRRLSCYFSPPLQTLQPWASSSPPGLSCSCHLATSPSPTSTSPSRTCGPSQRPRCSRAPPCPASPT